MRLWDIGTVASVNVFLASVLDTIDQSVWEFFVKNPALTSLAKAVTSVGVVYVLLPLSAVVGLYVWRRTSSVIVAVTPWIAVQLNSVVVANLKEWTNVPRPPREFWIVNGSAGSFPSGHVSNTTAFVVAVVMLMTALHPERQRIIIGIGIAACVAMAWSRLALNVHWFSDVVAGWFVGAATALVVSQLLQRFKSQRESQLQTHG